MDPVGFPWVTCARWASGWGWSAHLGSQCRYGAGATVDSSCCPRCATAPLLFTDRRGCASGPSHQREIASHHWQAVPCISKTKTDQTRQPTPAYATSNYPTSAKHVHSHFFAFLRTRPAPSVCTPSGSAGFLFLVATNMTGAPSSTSD